jgi:hypothetical protein
MRRVLVLTLALVCTAAAGGWYYVRVQGRAAETSLVDRYRLEWEHATEQEWIVDDIAEAILGLDGQSSTPGSRGRAEITTVRDAGAAPRFSVALSSGDAIAITIDHHIWAPAAYGAVPARARLRTPRHCRPASRR